MPASRVDYTWLSAARSRPGYHTIYLACPTALFRVRGGWHVVKDEFAERVIDTVQARWPGFRSTIVGRTVRTPQDRAQ
jgi:phytoene dehydrogenase-like protein